ncbi:unnamed protein product [Moneuplotes crassus]|uniref:Uncharacterized protein n=1 Tax=Euplotes crassus TaxID=5936 RepID=A0AAD1X4V8_EUPCR|nr:unnamed protein product [Moneuplotes crassus]
MEVKYDASNSYGECSSKPKFNPKKNLKQRPCEREQNENKNSINICENQESICEPDFQEKQKFLEAKFQQLKNARKDGCVEKDKDMIFYLLEKIKVLETSLQKERMINEELRIARESNNQELILAETKILYLENENKSFKEEITNLKTDLKNSTTSLQKIINTHKDELSLSKQQLSEINKMHQEQMNTMTLSLHTAQTQLKSLKLHIGNSSEEESELKKNVETLNKQVK